MEKICLLFVKKRRKFQFVFSYTIFLLCLIAPHTCVVSCSFLLKKYYQNKEKKENWPFFLHISRDDLFSWSFLFSYLLSICFHVNTFSGWVKLMFLMFSFVFLTKKTEWNNVKVEMFCFTKKVLLIHIWERFHWCLKAISVFFISSWDFTWKFDLL